MAEPETVEPASSVQRTADGRVIVRSRDGAIETVPEAQAEIYVAEGRGTLATPQDVTEADMRRQYGEGIGTEIRTGVEAGLDLATLGAFSAGTRLIGGDDAATAQRERFARNPVAKTTGELATLGALTLATGGAGGAAGAAARATPAGLALRGGLATERALSGGGALSQIGAMTAAGTIEGALFGAGQGVQDIALSERETDRTAEAALAHLGRTAGEGAVFGALGGLGAGALFVGGTAAARRAKRALAKGQAGLERRGAGAGARSGASATSRAESAADAAASASSRIGANADVTLDETFTITVDNRGPIQRLQDQASAAKRLGDQREAFIRDVTPELTDIHNATDLLAAEARRVKPSNAKRALDQMPIENYDATIARGSELLEEVRSAIVGMLGDDLAREGLRGRGATSLAKVRDASEAARKAIALGRDNAADVWGELNYYKGIVGRAAENARDSTAKALLDDHYHKLQQYLEDTQLWGGMGSINQGINPGFTRKLTADRVDTDLLSVAPTKSLSDPFRQGRQGDSVKTQSLFEALGDASGQTRVQNAREWLDAQAQFAELADSTYDLSPRARKLAARVKKARDTIVRKMEDAARTHADRRAFEELGGALNDIPFAATITKSLKAGASGVANATNSVTGKASGAANAAGEAAGSAAANSDLAVRAARLEGVRSAASNTVSSVMAAARSLASASGKAAKLALPAAAVVGAKTTRERFERAWVATRDFEEEPHAAVRRVWRAQGDIGRYAPQLAAAQAARVAVLGQLLASKLPRGDAPSIYGDDPEVPDVTPSEQREFLRYWRAANDPMSVIEDAADGAISAEGVEVLRVGYPELYGLLQRSVIDAMQQADKRPPYQTRLVLGELLELPTDPGLEPDMLVSLQASASATQEPVDGADSGGTLAPSQRRAPRVAASQRTRSQTLSERVR